MTVVESRVRRGTLTFGADPDSADFSCQPTNVRVTPTYEDDGDRTEVLCGDILLPGLTESWVLAGTSIQDFDNPEGFLTYCFEHRKQEVPFTWQPNVDGAPEWTGICRIVALEEGGDVNARITSDFEFAINGEPNRAYSSTASASAPAPSEPVPA